VPWPIGTPPPSWCRLVSRRVLWRHSGGASLNDPRSSPRLCRWLCAPGVRVYLALTLSFALIHCTPQDPERADLGPSGATSGDIALPETTSVSRSGEGDALTDDAETDAVDASTEDSADGARGCVCDASMWCNEGECVQDVCPEGESLCQDLSTRSLCAEDGSSVELIPCAEGEVCSGGACVTQVCDPEGEPVCEGVMRMACNSLGLELLPLPCPSGSGCMDGSCVPIEPNMLLIVDTSTSMSLLADKADTYPSECEGVDCPPWEFPLCEDPANPMTRIGRVKRAIDDFLKSESAQEARLALMRFPQTGLDYPNCQRGNYGHLFFMSGDAHQPESDFEWFSTQLFQTLCTGFSESAASNLEEMALWLDFEEIIAPSGQGCGAFWDCQWEHCAGGQCYSHTNHELRGSGPTPLGKSLFYAGEYLRHLVLNEGKACAFDADCRSPHYSCVDGACRDPFFACRETSIVLFTDGFETVYETTDEFFNPLVQAKRLQYGLGCSTSAECLQGAECTSGVCRFEGEEESAMMQCNAYASSCLSDADCPAFDCGLAEPCEGLCQDVSVSFVEPSGVDTLSSVEGTSMPITIHVVDASGTLGSNQRIATYGGGEYFSLELANLSALTAILDALVQAKPEATLCE